MSDAEFGGPTEAEVQSETQVTPVAPEVIPDREIETPIPGLPEAFEELRKEEIDKPIAVGTRGEDGKPTPDTKFVGHILETDSDRWHVIILDNGFALTVGPQSGGHERYGSTYKGSEPLYFPPGTSRVEIFKNMVDNARSSGAAVYDTTQDPASVDNITKKVQTAVEKARDTISARRTAREKVGQITVQAINAALNPDSRPPQG